MFTSLRTTQNSPYIPLLAMGEIQTTHLSLVSVARFCNPWSDTKEKKKKKNVFGCASLPLKQAG